MSESSKQAAYRRGLKAEDEALAHFEAQGFGLVGRRIRTAAGEIDLIVRRGELLVFVEVKARRGTLAAAEALSERQKARIARAAAAFLADRAENAAVAMRFDVVLVPQKGAIHHIENAFDLGETLWG